MSPPDSLASPRPAPPLSGDHLLTIREAVAEAQDRAGLTSMAERTRRGEMDDLPMMQAAVHSVERVLREMFA